MSSCPALLLAETDADAPSLELLEFLGSWETDDGQWMDPIQLLEEMDSETQAGSGKGGERAEGGDSDE